MANGGYLDAVEGWAHKDPDFAAWSSDPARVPCPKSSFLFVFPKRKDLCIALLQHQYDRFLKVIYGESSDEKNACVIEEYERCENAIGQKDRVAEAYADGALIEEDY